MNCTGNLGNMVVSTNCSEEERRKDVIVFSQICPNMFLGNVHLNDFFMHVKPLQESGVSMILRSKINTQKYPIIVMTDTHIF